VSVESKKRRHLLRRATRHRDTMLKALTEDIHRQAGASQAQGVAVSAEQVQEAINNLIVHDPKKMVERFKRRGRW